MINYSAIKCYCIVQAHYVDCPDFPVKCERCSQSVKKSGLEEHHSNHCPFVECSCGDIVSSNGD